MERCFATKAQSYQVNFQHNWMLSLFKAEKRYVTWYIQSECLIEAYFHNTKISLWYRLPLENK